MDYKHLSARFYDHAQLDVAASKKAGTQQYTDVVMVELSVKGARGESISKAVTDANREELAEAFPRAWAQHKGESFESIGTDLKVLNFTPARVKELEALGLYSVEELAEVLDGNISKIREGMSAKNAAKRYLESQVLVQQDVTVAAIDEMRAQIEELKASNEELAKNQKKKPGRPPRVEDGENTQAAM